MTTGPRVRPSGGRRGSGGGFTRRRRGRSTLKTEEIDYKDVQLMRRFVSERGKIISGGRIGVTAKNQRRLARAIKRAQHLALVPIAPNHTYVTGAIQTEAQQRQQEAPASESEATEETSEQTEEVVSQDETPVAQTEDSASDEPASERPTSEESTADDAQSDESEAPPEAETSDD